jgi:Rrf2 family protein
MTLPARIEYSLRALAALALAQPAALTARTLAETQHLPHGYVHNLLADLRRADLVYALRGNHGGYALAQPAHQITLGAVVRLLDGSFHQVRPAASRDAGPDQLAARLRQLWGRADQAGLQLLDEVTLADLVSTQPSGDSA